MQLHTFRDTDGHVLGYCAHKVHVPPYPATFSIWMDAEGRLTDAESRRRDGATVAVSPRLHHRLWGLLAAEARRLHAAQPGF